MDFWGYPSDLCLFADNLQNPVTDDEEQESIKNKTLNILYSCFILFLHLQRERATNVAIKFKNQTTRTYFFNVTVQISGQTLNLLS